jgi:hypothetical protein
MERRAEDFPNRPADVLEWRRHIAGCPRRLAGNGNLLLCVCPQRHACVQPDERSDESLVFLFHVCVCLFNDNGRRLDPM